MGNKTRIYEAEIGGELITPKGNNSFIREIEKADYEHQFPIKKILPYMIGSPDNKYFASLHARKRVESIIRGMENEQEGFKDMDFYYGIVREENDNFIYGVYGFKEPKKSKSILKKILKESV